jgi:hypothetical protein
LQYKEDLSCFLFDSLWIVRIFLIVQTIDIANYKEDLSSFLFDSRWILRLFSPRPDIDFENYKKPFLFSLRFSLDFQDIFSSSRLLTLQTTKKAFPVFSSILVGFPGYFLLVQTIDFANYKNLSCFLFA